MDQNNQYEPEQNEYQTPPQEIIAAEDNRNFWQRNGATIITVAVLGLIIGGAIAVNENRSDDLDGDVAITDDNGQDANNQDQTPDENGTTDNEAEPAQPDQGENTGDPNNGGNDTGTISGGEATVSVAASGHYVTTAEQGDGRTHLARRAITEYLRDTGTQLSDEQRVYAEDHLQKQYEYISPLHPGDSASFAGGDIAEAVSGAQSLTDAQIQNLHQYSVLVNFPPI